MKLTITTLVIVEGSYIQGIFHSLEEHPDKAYQELVDQVENEYGYDPIIQILMILLPSIRK